MLPIYEYPIVRRDLPGRGVQVYRNRHGRLVVRVGRDLSDAEQRHEVAAAARRSSRMHGRSVAAAVASIAIAAIAMTGDSDIGGSRTPPRGPAADAPDRENHATGMVHQPAAAPVTGRTRGHMPTPARVHETAPDPLPVQGVITVPETGSTTGPHPIRSVAGEHPIRSLTMQHPVRHVIAPLRPQGRVRQHAGLPFLVRVRIPEAR